MELLVSYLSPQNKAKASSLAKKLDLIFLPQEDVDLDKYCESYFLIYQPTRSYIQKGTRNSSRDIYCDFTDWSCNFNDPLLSKCLRGLPDKFTALDATAGFGKDALEIAKSPNCHSIHLIEREKWLFYLLNEGIANSEDPKTINYLNKFTIENDDSFKFLTKNKTNFDLIYFDPLFSGVRKSKAKKTIQALRDLTQETNAKGFLDLAIRNSSKRVVVKRHKKSQYLEGIKPAYSVTGKVVRYDIYNSS